MKKVLLSLGIIALVAGVVAGATFAFFSDTATVEGNTFSTGSADLEIRRVDAGSWGDSISGVDFDNIYPGWVAEETIQLRNDSSADIGMDIVPEFEREAGTDSDMLRDLITLQFFDEEGNAKGSALTLSDWKDSEWVLDHLPNGEESQVWTLRFELPSTGENQNELQDSDAIGFNLVFNGIQADTIDFSLSEDESGDNLDYNQENKDNDWPYIEWEEKGDRVEVTFINPTSITSDFFFDYRVDNEEGSAVSGVTGETSPSGRLEGKEWGDFYNFVSVGPGESETRIIEGNDRIEVRLFLGPERDYDFYWIVFTNN